jgi:hypothetical protein
MKERWPDHGRRHDFLHGKTGGRWERKYIYKLISGPLKVIFTDRPRIFRTKE